MHMSMRAAGAGTDVPRTTPAPPLTGIAFSTPVTGFAPVCSPARGKITHRIFHAPTVLWFDQALTRARQTLADAACGVRRAACGVRTQISVAAIQNKKLDQPRIVGMYCYGTSGCRGHSTLVKPRTSGAPSIRA